MSRTRIKEVLRPFYIDRFALELIQFGLLDIVSRQTDYVSILVEQEYANKAHDVSILIKAGEVTVSDIY